MEFRIIKSPSKGTIDILMKRLGIGVDNDLSCVGAIGLVQGRMIDMIFAVDIAEKAVGVTVSDIKGSCPQNMIMIAIFGDTASVESAILEIKSNFKKEKTIC
ncbi:BMC domain-containing protein [Crassaminicella indica]|uniref:BMC domain-containing protein n=1 Tax=Crassaminicella indica TaxID=2855394 RepID=A0ABX8RB02_9CLOT|nr:BMC domain-containing protein [Crassaminicella indica]QXM05105.1 BMC domain-containing protein [Crassaminicella indica]